MRPWNAGCAEPGADAGLASISGPEGLHQTESDFNTMQTEGAVTPPGIDFYTAGDGRRLAARVWRTAQSPRARVVFLHGITSHGGWYEQIARHLAGAGFQVQFLDRRGSGLNANQPGDVDDWRTWIDDVAGWLGRVVNAGATGSQRCRLPTILCGISWGGKLAAAVARRHAGWVDGLALACPGIYSPYLPGVFRRAVLAAPAPRGLQNRRVRVPLRHPELFTGTAHWRDFIEHDPLALRSVTWRFAQEDRRLTRYARAAASFLHLPVLLMLAGRDRIVDNRRTREFFGQIPGNAKTLIEYPGAGHTLEFERDPSAYFADFSRWIERTVNAAVGESYRPGGQCEAGVSILP
jgi:alpha-beta hydrolase superfamily lysophospholipase